MLLDRLIFGYFEAEQGRIFLSDQFHIVVGIVRLVTQREFPQILNLLYIFYHGRFSLIQYLFPVYW